MGQYHILVNVDKREWVDPWDIALGSKQWEHTSGESWPLVGSLADAMYILTMTSPARGGGDLPKVDISSRWAGDRVMIVGDYTEDEDLPPEFLGSELYTTAQNSYTNITDKVRLAFTQIFDIKWQSEEHSFGTVWSRKVKESAST
jgi:hypothetical protein